MKFEFTKEWMQSFTLEEDMADCSAGVLRYDLASFAEPDPVDATTLVSKRKVVRRRPRTSSKSSAAATTKSS